MVVNLEITENWETQENLYNIIIGAIPECGMRRTACVRYQFCKWDFREFKTDDQELKHGVVLHTYQDTGYFIPSTLLF